MQTRTQKTIPASVASRISRTLCAKIGTPESSTGSLLGVWHSEVTWRIRRNDGSGWAKLGFGPLRALVSLSYRDNATESAILTVYA